MSVDNVGEHRLMASFGQLQELVDKLQKENWSLTGKLKSCSTVGTFYHEARQEVRRLGEQLSLKEALLQELQTRLAAYQSSSLLLAQGAPCSLPGVAPSLLDGLLHEIDRVKKEQADSAQDCQREQERLNEELRETQRQLREEQQRVELMLGRSPYEKDAEIAALHRALRETERQQATREVWCRSLAEQSEQLQLRLAGTANMCQHLAQQLERQRDRPSGTEQAGPTDKATEQRQGDTPETTLSRVQEENGILKQKVIYVEDLNTKWQKYDIGREDYVKRLHLELKELRSRLGQPAGFGAPQASGDMLRQEIARLNGMLEEKMKEYQCLAGCRDGLDKERTISHQLRQQLNDLQAVGGLTREHVQMLEQQVLVYKEDFRSEREDRERAHSRIQELEEEVARFRLQLPRKQELHESGASRHGKTNACRLEVVSASPMLGMGTEWSPPDPSARSPGSEQRPQGLLQCPKCMRLFNDEVSEECLRHIAECCQ
ncbi:TNFAIP3-interacting protein 2 [Rhinoraja longicauda]